MVDHRYIEEHNLIERYVLGRLATDEQVRFEEHFADCEVCLGELEIADDFGAALRTAVAEDAQRTMGAMTVVGRWLQLARSPAFRRALAMLLVVGLALPSLWLLRQNRRLTADLESLRQPHANVPSMLLSLTRDGTDATAPVLVVPPEEPWVTLDIEADDPAFVRYHVALTDLDGEVRWQRDGLDTNLWNVLHLTFPTDLLPAGAYRLRLTGQDAAGRSEPIGDYPFRIELP